MIPTIFGLTIVSFCIMKLAPGDPLQDSNSSGNAGQGSLNRERYLLTKRDLKLDLPLLLNFRHVYNYKPALKQCATFRYGTIDQLASQISSGLSDEQLKFARSLKIPEFEISLKDSRRHKRLATEIKSYVQVYCEDAGRFAVRASIDLLLDEASSREEKIGIIDCLNHMVVEKHQYTFTKDPQPQERELVLSVWQTWWNRNKKKLPPLDPDRRKEAEEAFAKMLDAPGRKELFQLLEDAYFDFEDMSFFAEKITADGAPLNEQILAAIILKLYIPKPLEMQSSRKAKPESLAMVIENWQVHFDNRTDIYSPSWFGKLGTIFFDTQYSHMVMRLVTFQFGRSATTAKEPVSKLLWEAFLVSAPLMLLAQFIIYTVAVPMGVVCGVNRGNSVDRMISLGLFILYSIPAFVAGMLFLLFFCYADYLQIFPMGGLVSSNFRELSLAAKIQDYCSHAFLPVTCLSLFSLAAVAMYSRTSLLDAIGQDYIRTARAKGLPQFKVIFKHAFRNSLIPVLTLFSNILPAMLGGSILIEYLFNIPGMGRLGFESILRRDFPTLMALLYIQALVVMFSILLTDILYVLVDPRISFSAQEGS